MPKPKVIIAKLGLDGHDRGAKVIARALAEAGFEVVYTGIRQTPSQVIETAIQEDAKLIGISILSGSHMELIGELMRIMRERGVSIPVLVGGIIPPEDRDALLKMGVAGVYGPGTPLREIIDIVKKLTGVS
ncbi:MAG: cobalamin B12-binding domain-containing protein [Vulcanisaeta sp.]|jgi:methylmalonyl-CoA mutase C-terminal domain/subunit|uniref:cobalamin B12-binding domain-containing protein n=1 Tax=Vulcanisaeta sp. EB80 TaxID=1650660 RepID=UPI0007481CF3|nr:cobalamin B12-binding domain-containing protein [Vulcanisaeta sp. EB80]KUO81858.1 MAG: methylmalonyl-CoA mutase [Vulcanisaeta sp. JCHS_4]KUO88992.1 MAG: methylmalonyl-CoA mutase [Vulcanisaeta sp. MG_3]KUO93409.1 MAG: methylmalonyl-CoA mutase [Vulcanisaeta sp. CIS_19]MCG2864519.1 cobalamin B12-binding domain-containing protein [Vulcanisaeta sp.]MCG2866233.1 cobalamin B12-binding domain-containing protein [Vulcanisaeta sp.]